MFIFCQGPERKSSFFSFYCLFSVSSSTSLAKANIKRAEDSRTIYLANLLESTSNGMDVLVFDLLILKEFSQFSSFTIFQRLSIASTMKSFE